VTAARMAPIATIATKYTRVPVMMTSYPSRLARMRPPEPR
jgi:hypothetical protein